MKRKHLFIALLSFIALSSFNTYGEAETPRMEVVKKVDWTQPFSSSFTDPYAVEREIDEAFYNGQRCLHVYIKLSHSVNYSLLYTFEHAGEWYGDGGSGIKYFEIVYPPNTLEKHTYFPLHSTDQPTWGWFNEIYFGPQ